MVQPLLGGDGRDPDGLGRGVVLVHDRAPPLDDLLLDRDRAGGRGVEGDLLAAEVVALADLGGQLEQAHEHGRDPLAVGHPVGLDGGQRRLLVEGLHHHGRAPEPVHGHAELQRGGVVAGRGRQVDGVLADPVHPEALDGETGLTQRLVLEREPDAFGPPGGARRVEHGVALDLVVPGIARHRRQGVLVGVVAGHRAVHDQPGRHRLGQPRDQRSGDPAHRRRGHEGLGVAVADDVGDLLGREVGVDRGVVEAGALGRPADLEEAGLVLDQEGDVVAEPEPGGLPDPGHPAGAFLQLGVGDHGPRTGHDDRGVIRALLGVETGPHHPDGRRLGRDPAGPVKGRSDSWSTGRVR